MVRRRSPPNASNAPDAARIAAHGAKADRRGLTGERAIEIIEATTAAVLIVQRSGAIDYANRAADHLFGGKAPHLDDVVDPEARLVLRRLLRDRSRAATAEISYRRRDGTRFFADSTIGRLGGSGQEVWLTLRDVTERRQREDHYRNLAYSDSLTKLANRQSFERRIHHCLTEWITRKRRFALMMIDLDKFKEVNDTLGHDAGDEVLLAVAEILATQSRSCDLPARLGGDEFAIAIGELEDLSDCEAIAQRICERVSTPLTIAGSRVEIGASIGIAVCPEDGEDHDQLARQADLALYSVKRAGRNGYAFSVPEMNEGVRRRDELAKELRAALARDGVAVLFHPILDVATRRYAGFDAAASWRNARGERIAPEEILSIAKETGQLADLTRLTLCRALNALRGWRAAGAADVVVTVSASPLASRYADFTKIVGECLRQTQAPPDGLCLLFDAHVFARAELGEEISMSFKLLAKIGVRLALSGFDAERIDIAELRRWPFGMIRLDDDLARALAEDGERQFAVRAIAALAQSCGYLVAARCANAERDGALLAQLGCDWLQGPSIAEEVNREEAMRLLTGPSPQAAFLENTELIRQAPLRPSPA